MGHFGFNPECPHLPFVTRVMLRARVLRIFLNFQGVPLPTCALVSICVQFRVPLNSHILAICSFPCLLNEGCSQWKVYCHLCLLDTEQSLRRAMEYLVLHFYMFSWVLQPPFHQLQDHLQPMMLVDFYQCFISTNHFSSSRSLS
jgi:hypothetical protein